jgi:pantetheine-phosphate adenylyltransferase
MEKAFVPWTVFEVQYGRLLKGAMDFNNMMKHKAIYPGTFDPVTNGHVDIIIRAARLFPKLVVAVAHNAAKSPFFPLETRIQLIKESLGELPGVAVLGFDCLLIDFVRQQDASIILRGLRAVNDFEYEFQLAGMNRKLCKDVETVFLTPSEHLLFISSTLVREIAQLGGEVSQFVPPAVVRAFQHKKTQAHD